MDQGDVLQRIAPHHLPGQTALRFDGDRHAFSAAHRITRCCQQSVLADEDAARCAIGAAVDADHTGRSFQNLCVRRAHPGQMIWRRMGREQLIQPLPNLPVFRLSFQCPLQAADLKFTIIARFRQPDVGGRPRFIIQFGAADQPIQERDRRADLAVLHQLNRLPQFLLAAHSRR